MHSDFCQCEECNPSKLIVALDPKDLRIKELEAALDVADACAAECGILVAYAECEMSRTDGLAVLERARKSFLAWCEHGRKNV